MKILTFTLVVALVSPGFFQSASASSSNLQANDYFIKVKEIELSLPSQQNEGSLTLVNDQILVVRRLGQVVFLDRQLTQMSEWKNSLELEIEVFEQRSFGERGLEGVKAILFDEKSRSFMCRSLE